MVEVQAVLDGATLPIPDRAGPGDVGTTISTEANTSEACKTTVPDPVRATWLLTTVAGPDSRVIETGKPELAVAVKLKGPLP